MKLSNLKETVVIKNIEKAAQQFKSNINKLINRSDEITLFDEKLEYLSDDVFVSFGKQSLPTEKNTVVVGNKFHDKKGQFQKLKGKVNTINTYTDHLALTSKKFIAKKNVGQKQHGQLINELPANSEDYIFQGLVNILAEFRVIVYYMNGHYRVSGIYKKTGSNVSLSQVSQSSKNGKMINNMAVKSVELLGYGFGGVDIAIVSAENLADLVLGESVLGVITSKSMKLIGKISGIDELMKNNYLVILEVNSLPSMSNPGILFDFLKNIQSNTV